MPWALDPTTEPGALARVYARFRDAAGNESVGTEVGTIRFEPISVGGTASFLVDGSDSFGGSIAILAGIAASLFAILAAGGWYGRRRWKAHHRPRP